MNQEVSGLFGQKNVSDVESNSDSIAEGWKSLQTYEEEEVVNQRAGVNMFLPEFSRELDTGKGRDDLVEYVHKHVSGEYDLSAWDEYSPEDTVDLSVFLLDEVDENEGLRGKDVVEYVREFIEQDGEPRYLEDLQY